MDLKSGTVESSLPVKVEWVKVSCLSLEGEHGPKEEHLMERMGKKDLPSFIQFFITVCANDTAVVTEHSS